MCVYVYIYIYIYIYIHIHTHTGNYKYNTPTRGRKSPILRKAGARSAQEREGAVWSTGPYCLETCLSAQVDLRRATPAYF